MYTTIGVFNNSFPPEGPKVIDRKFVAGAAGEFLIDLMMEIEQQKVSNVQGLYFNNVEGSDIELICVGTDQRISIASGAQGSIILFVTGAPRFTVSASGAGTTRFHFVNFPVNTHVF